MAKKNKSIEETKTETPEEEVSPTEKGEVESAKEFKVYDAEGNFTRAYDNKEVAEGFARKVAGRTVK